MMGEHDKVAAGLRARLAELTGQVGAIGVELSAPLDADFAEQAAELEGQDALKTLETAHLVEAEAIRAALGRIEAGSYGTCAKCGCDIPAARLAAVPTATMCIKCAA
jgi:RNA polymerase-binding transcription factor DksA